MTEGGTVTVAIVGVVGTLLGAVVGAVLAPWASGRTERRLRILDRRLDTYADLLEVAGHMRDNAQTLASVPLANLPDPPVDRVRSMDARIRVVGSDRVREATDRVAILSNQFQRDLFLARPREARVKDSGVVDTPETIKARMDLGAIADQMTEAIKELESRIRSEMRIDRWARLGSIRAGRSADR